MLFICIMLFLFFAFKKTKKLRIKGYDYVYYYIINCGKLEYYRNPDKLLGNLFYSNYDELVSSRNKWYVKLFNKENIEELILFYEKADALSSKVSPYFSLSHFFAHSECMMFKNSVREMEKLINTIVNVEFRKHVLKQYNDPHFAEYSENTEYKHQFLVLRDKHNNEFVEKELIDNKQYFDTIMNYPLDEQQRRSVVILEDNCLVISSAGSGKTSTSIGKVKYLLDKRKLNKEEILVLSYNRKTAEEFQERLNVPGLTCKTFHSLAMSIIAKVEQRRPDICQDTFLLECYYNLINNNEAFKAAVNKFITKVASLTKLDHEYKIGEKKKYYEDREIYGIMAPYGDMDGGPIFTRSEEEKKICTWLTEHGVDFKYEERYPINTADGNYRQYKPDFTIYFTKDGRRYYAFLEHFGIDANGNVPEWFGEGKEGGFAKANMEYNEGIRWKRNLHRENNTCLLETTSAMFHDGTIFQRLEQQLRNIGVNIRELSIDEKHSLLFERNQTMEENVMKLFSSFISLMKSNGKSFESILKTIIDSGQKKDFCERSRFLMFEVIKPLYDKYQSELERQGMMDYTDLILYATELCNKGHYQSPFSYIIVDEFQDISVDRYKFIRALQNPNLLTKTYCVGDDWQSIYRFTGSDMNLFNQFEKFFGYTVKCKIETTYRFGNPLVDNSSRFILKNPSQVKKVVKPLSNSARTELSFIPFKRQTNREYLAEIEHLLNAIPRNESVMLIARYNYDVRVFPNNCIRQVPNSNKVTVTYAGRTMQFMSVHAAKGLEADNVIVLNCSQDGGGFPSRVSDDPILGFLLSDIDDFEYSEERRLFYVAITRAKKHTYVMYNLDMPSVFVTEFINDDVQNQDNIMICPACGRGHFKLMKDAIARNNNKYRFYVCSNSIAGCDNRWIVFFNDEDEIQSKYYEMVAEVNNQLQLDIQARMAERRRRSGQMNFDSLLSDYSIFKSMNK